MRECFRKLSTQQEEHYNFITSKTTVKGKFPLFSVYPILTEFSVLLMCSGSSTTTKQFSSSLSDAEWVFYNLTEFGHSQPGDSTRSCRLQTRPHKTVSFSPKLQTPICCYLCFWPTNKGPHNSLLGFNCLLKGLTEPRKTVWLLLLIYYKGYFKRSKWTARWKRCTGQGIWEGIWNFHTLSRNASLPALYSATWELSEFCP